VEEKLQKRDEITSILNNNNQEVDSFVLLTMVSNLKLELDPQDESAIPEDASWWIYKDPSGNLQGPFDHEIMNDWCEDGAFPDDLELAQIPESAFTKLATFTKNRSVQRPFLPSNIKQEEKKSEDGVPPFWYYKDSEGTNQGPFSIEEMVDWYADGHFSDQLEVAGVKEETSQAPTTFKTVQSYETNPFVE